MRLRTPSQLSKSEFHDLGGVFFGFSNRTLGFTSYELYLKAALGLFYLRLKFLPKMVTDKHLT